MNKLITVERGNFIKIKYNTTVTDKTLKLRSFRQLILDPFKIMTSIFELVSPFHIFLMWLGTKTTNVLIYSFVKDAFKV